MKQLPGPKSLRFLELSSSQAADFRLYSHLFSLVVAIMDALGMCADELEYVWSSPRSIMKVFYLLSRYGGLAYQVTAFVTTFSFMRHVPIDPKVCTWWFLTQSAAFFLLIHLLEYTFFLRVYALYRKNRVVGGGLLCLLGAQICVAVGCTIMIATMDKEVGFDETCLSRRGTPPVMIVFFALAVLYQTLVWGLTYAKRTIDFRDLSPGSPDSKVIRTFVCDGSVVFLGVLVSSFTLLPYSIMVQRLVHITLSPLISLMSIAICRLTLNFLKLKSPAMRARPEIELTSIFEDLEM